MADLVTWVSDELHAITGISERSIAEFLIHMAGKAPDVDQFLVSIRNTDSSLDADAAGVADFARRLLVWYF